MMNIDIEKLKEMAGNLMSINDIAILLDVDEDSLRCEIGDRGSEVSKIYHKAKTKTIYEIKKQEVEFAKAGSPHAIEVVGNYIVEQSMKENG